MAQNGLTAYKLTSLPSQSISDQLSHFISPENVRKTLSFLMFSGDIKMEILTRKG